MHARVRSWVNKHWSDDLSKRGGTYDVIFDLRFGGWFTESNLYVSVQILNFNTWLNRDPVQFHQNLLGARAPIIESKPGSKILDALELVNIETWHVEKWGVAVIKSWLDQRNSNQNSHIVSKRAPDVSKGSEMKMTSLAQCCNVSIESEIWIHYDTETGNLIGELNHGVRYVDRWCGRECSKSLMSAKEYGFWFVWIEGKAVKTEPRVQSR